MRIFKTKNGYLITRILSRRSNVFLISFGDKHLLIDTSVKRNLGRLEKGLAELKITAIDYLILTHAHFDHAANAAAIRKRYGAKVLIHSLEAGNLSSGKSNMPGGTNPITRAFVNRFGPTISSLVRCEPCSHDTEVENEYSFRENGLNILILHTPGHSAGSISVIVDDEIALVGDAMFGISKWSVFPPYADNVGEMIRSWGKLLATNCTLFLPSHGSANSRALLQKDFDRRRLSAEGKNRIPHTAHLKP